MTEILPAFEVLVNNNCLTIAEAIEKAYIAGHRAATKALESPQLSLVLGSNVTSTRGVSQK